MITLKYEFEEMHFLRSDKKFPYFKPTKETQNYISFNMNNLNNKKINFVNLDIILPFELEDDEIRNLPKDTLIVS